MQRIEWIISEWATCLFSLSPAYTQLGVYAEIWAKPGPQTKAGQMFYFANQERSKKVLVNTTR